MSISAPYKTHHIFLHLCLGLIICLLMAGTDSYAQTRRGKKQATVVDTIPFLARWNFRTNAVDWALTIPNVAVEFDLGNSVFNKYTVGLAARYNWNTRHDYLPSTVFNLTDIRLEARQYFRTIQRNDPIPDTINFFKKIKEKYFNRRKMHPRYWRAYYGGIYVHGGDYAVKLGSEGVKGTHYGVGVSGGFSVPLYGYRKSAVDLEIGASIGFVYTNSKRFTHDPESNCYPIVEDKGGHFVPYPLLTDLRIAFVYRFMSVSGKYKEGLTKGQERRRAAAIERRNRRQAENDSINALREKVEKEQAELLEQLRRHQADSLGISVDSLLNLQPKELTKDERRALKAKEKAEKETRKAAEKEAKKAAEEAKKAEKAAKKAEAKKEAEVENKAEAGKEVEP